ncbi:MAG: 23S rRNA (pseudouridine(1915)-N(3))-methyltransferase RlmH [Bdellovibrionota bacterium]
MKKLSLLVFQNKTEKWAEEAAEGYVKKLKPFIDFNRVSLKSPQFDREDRNKKLAKESEILLKALQKGDTLILFDERGKKKTSVEFAKLLEKEIEMTPTRICLVIGGPYGFSDEIKQKAKLALSLSDLTFNHHLAQIVALEQIYRAFTIMKGLPYHNE